MLDIFPKELGFGSLAFDYFCVSRIAFVCVHVCVCTHAYAPVLLNGEGQSKSVVYVSMFVCICMLILEIPRK